MTLSLSCSILNCQDNRYSRLYPLTTQDSLITPGAVIKTDIANIQYCLNKYYKERQIGIYCEIGTAVTGAACFYTALYSDAHRMRQILIITSVGLAAATLAIHIDAEKWLKRASIKLSPGSFKVYF